MEVYNMSNQISGKSADLQVNIIGIFYLFSALHEIFFGLFAYESVTSPGFSMDPIRNYNHYLLILGIISFAVSIGIFCRSNFARKGAIALTWWDLFTAPAIDIYMDYYTRVVRKLEVLYVSTGMYYLYTALLFLIMSAIRIYIINTLNTSRAGYVFLEKKA